MFGDRTASGAVVNIRAAIFTDAIISGKEASTPFGAVTIQSEEWGMSNVAIIGAAADPRARVVAAKELGVTHVIGVGRAVALGERLAMGDLVLPADALDFTRDTPTTFFENRGLGYVQQSPPFCFETINALQTAFGDQAQRVEIVAVGPERPFTPAELRAWSTLGAEIAMRGLAPEWYLCHELEIGYAALGTVAWRKSEQASEVPDWHILLEAVVAALPAKHSWQGSNTAARNALGDDWHDWIKPVRVLS